MDNRSGTRILVIDDEKQIRRLLKVTLSEHDYEVEEAVDGREGINKVLYCKPDLIILDLGLPDLDGIEVVKKLREWSGTPIIIISVREQENDKIAALDAGADDYVTKPFGMGELLARIRAAMRHASGAGDEPVMNFDELAVDIAHRRVTVGEKEIKLTPTEYEILKNLAVCAGKVLTHKQLLRAVWGPAYQNDAQYLRVYVGQLRRKIEVDPSRPRHIITEPGVGYRLL
ncbi:MAG: KDP operon transcriptional regulatory protein KdpE [Pelotomaculum sp. PtaB.Bin013]|uniref:Stage 0 sporulation protein A homolog n=1 Tax=Pelotomaculum isophthalicicum JI TaxID=947010 RepID=A0A9X4H2B3_9FIRM|nr:response regulator [Pelotomaculum isophthalicicum]MDF9408781.1 response regulator [Pelotomaculum isophthalicicum JI]OPX91892.1 MAG: KDP operon transcriptional regulatory protein KdpE [Pelotomaculum sp. PtaB.Bin013]